MAEIPHLAAVREAFGSREDFVMIGITIDSDADEKRVRRFIKDKSLTWPQVFGAAGKAQQASDACGVQFIPQTFLVGPDGVVAGVGLLGPGMKDSVAGFLAGVKSADD